MSSNNYCDIPPEIRPFVEVTEGEFDSYPEFIKEAAHRLARERWLKAGAPRSDSVRYPIEYSVANEDLDELLMDELTDYYYEHHVRQSTMGIEDHRFVLRHTMYVPSPWQYINMVAYNARVLNSTNATVQYVDNDDIVHNLSFSRNDLDTHTVNDLLEMLQKGRDEWQDTFYGGSDYIRDAISTYSLAMGQFTITVSHIKGGYGKMIPDYYQTLGLENNGHDCLIQCFLYIHSLNNPQASIPSSDAVRRDLLKHGGLGLDSIPILEEMFLVEVDVLRDQRVLEFNYDRTVGRGISLLDSFKATIVRDEPVVIHGTGSRRWQLLYKDNHYDVITKTYPASKCHCPHTGNFVGYCKKYTKKDLIREMKRKYRPDEENLTEYCGSDDEEEKDVFYYFFDYETVFDPQTMEIIPYAYAIVKCDSKINVIDTRCDIGIGCDVELSKYLFNETPTDEEVKYLIGYNNSRFDNFILLKHSLKHNDYVGHVRFSSSTIISASISKFIVRDLCRILNMSLDKACKSFKIDLPKLTGMIRHHEVQMRYMDGEDSFLRYLDQARNTIRDYVVRDCVSLSQLYKVTKNVMLSLTELQIENHYTLPGMSYARFTDIIDKDKSIRLPILTKNHEIHDRFVRKSIIGGRSQMRLVKREQQDLCAIDCVSLYPYVMLNRKYPVGNPRNTKRYMPGYIGVYNVIIHRQPTDKLNVVPLRDEHSGRLKWNYKDEIECVLCSVDVECLKRHGGGITITDGIYWDKTDSHLFDQYFKPLITEKQRQDSLLRDSTDASDPCKPGSENCSSLIHWTPSNVEDSSRSSMKNDLSSDWRSDDSFLQNLRNSLRSQYNPAIREMCKLLMNSLSGKLAQRLHTTETEIVRNAGDIDQFYNKTISGTQTFVKIGSAYIAQGRKEPVATTPCIYGVLIYAYAREHMYESILCHLNPDELYGMDTDSAFITHECLSRIISSPIGSATSLCEVDNKNNLMGDDFGQFKIELKDCNGIFIAPKCYIFYSPAVPTHIANATCVPVTDPEPRSDKETATGATCSPEENMGSGCWRIEKARFKGVKVGKDIELPDDVDTEDTIALYKAYHSIKSEKIGLNTFQRLLNTGHCRIVCCNIEKLVSAPKQNVALYLTNHTFIKYVKVECEDLIINDNDTTKISVTA